MKEITVQIASRGEIARFVGNSPAMDATYWSTVTCAMKITATNALERVSIAAGTVVHSVFRVAPALIAAVVLGPCTVRIVLLCTLSRGWGPRRVIR